MEFKICIIPQKVYLSMVFDSKLLMEEIENRYSFHVSYSYRTISLYTLTKYNRKNCYNCKPNHRIRLNKVSICYNPTIKKFCYHALHKNIYVIDTILRLVSTLILLFHNGILLHAAGVVKDNKKCILFVGETNSGKSTLAKNFSNKRVLSDEVCPLIFFNDKLYSWRSMFYSEVVPVYSKLSLVEIDKIIFLRKFDDINNNGKLLRLFYEDKFVLLLKNTLWFTKDHSLTKLLIDLIVKIAGVDTIGYFEANMLKHFWTLYDKI
ncbi:MAG: hypothetical protein N2555_05805 [Endomicrobia bacterium]|nr:hypothetical protein [Endomicrobiia bacterium]